MSVRRAGALLLPPISVCRRRLLRLAAPMAWWSRRLLGCRRPCLMAPMLAALLAATLLIAALASASPAPAQKMKQPQQQQQHLAQQPNRQLSLTQSTRLLSNASSVAAGGATAAAHSSAAQQQQQQQQPQSPPPAAAAAAAAAAEKPTPQVHEFLRRVAESSDPQLLAALRTKLPLLNRLSEVGGAGGAERTLLERAKSCSTSPHATLALKHVQNFAYLHQEPDLCSGQLLLIAAVHSNAKNFNRRATIRRTWGSLRYVGINRLQLVFFLGTQDSQQVQREIDEESRRYRDLVQLDFREHYRNMSLKHLSIYEWVLGHCPSAQYLLKVDDDTFTDVVHLVSFLQHSPPEGFYCSNTKGAKPQRLKRGPKAKWAVSRLEFSGVRYPAYCEGFGYVVQASRLADLYICSLFHKFFWIDDVYVTGVLTAAAKVPLAEFWKGHSYTGQLPSLASEKILDYVFLVADHNEFLEVVWHRLWRSVLQYSLDLTL